MTEDEMARWHHWLTGCESEWAPGVGDGQGSLACCDSQGLKESDTTEHWTEPSVQNNCSVMEIQCERSNCSCSSKVLKKPCTWVYLLCECQLQMLNFCKTSGWSTTFWSVCLTYIADGVGKPHGDTALVIATICLVWGFCMKGTLKLVEAKNALFPLVSGRYSELWSSFLTLALTCFLLSWTNEDFGDTL